MGLTVTSLSQLSADLVAQLQAEFTQFMQERYPAVELTRGSIHDIVAHLSGGVSGAVTRTEVQRAVDAGSLMAIAADPTLADDSVVDAVLSNYRITRRSGNTATGQIVITVTDPITVIVPAGAAYIAHGVTFVVDDAFVAKPPGSAILAITERVLEPRGANLYSFTVPATATTEGDAGNIRRGTKLDPDPAPDRFVTAFAATDFANGRDIETNDAILDRMAIGIAAPVMQGRTNIVALLNTQPAFADVLHYSIIGFGNEEMTRDQHTVFPVSLGGRVDIYARTVAVPVTTQLRKAAVLVEKLTVGGVWQFSLTRTDAPGFYDVVQILLPTDPEDAGGFLVTLDQRGFDLTGITEPVPDVVTAIEAAYSKYQTAVIRFTDTQTNTAAMTLGDTADYLVAVRAMPLLDDIQEFCRSSGNRNLAADVLVKAPVPCFLSINVVVEQAPGEVAPDTAVIRNDIATVVNALDFPGRLDAATVVDTVSRYLTTRQVVARVELLGRIRRPDGTSLVIRDQQILRVPATPSRGVTGRTTAFILDPRDIAVSVLTQGFNRHT